MLLQKHNGKWKTISFASYSVNNTKHRNAQIEKEVLAITWACQKFSLSMSLGSRFNWKQITHLWCLFWERKVYTLYHPKCNLRFRLCLMKFEYTINHEQNCNTFSTAPVNDQLDSLTKLLAKDFDLFSHSY